MNYPIRMTRIADADGPPLPGRHPIGAFSYREVHDGDLVYRAMFLLVPDALNPDGSACRCPLGDTSKTPRWTLSGSDDVPTLSPSIHVFVDDRNGKRTELWHGFVRNGELVL